jgi:EmrB/QacA subfamily drug resistance transporter
MSVEAHAAPTAALESSPVRFTTARGRWVLAIAVLGSAIAFLEATVTNVALPTIGRDLGASVSGLEWVLNGYLLTLAALILLGGSLGDRYGRRLMFNIGVAWFTIASAACAAAPNVEVLVAGRVVQGIGGALLTPASLAIIEATFAPGDRGRAIGAWSALTGIGGAVGPLVGGYLIDAVSWRAIFLINLPLGAFVVAMALRHVPETRDPTVHGRLDVAGSVLAIIGLGGLTFALIESSAGLAPAAIAAAAAVGALALAAFVAVEHRAEMPMLPLSIFASRQFTAANILTFIVYGALGGVFFLLVATLQVTLGYTPLEAGASSLPITVLMLALSSRAGAWAERNGPRLPLTIGPALIAAGMLMLGRIDADSTYLGTVLPALIVFGLGLSATVAPITATALAAADARHSGVASGVNNAVARTAQLAAVAVLPLAAGITGSDFQHATALADGFRIAMMISAAAALSGSVLAWATISNDVLARGGGPGQEQGEHCTHCAVAGTPLRERRDRQPSTDGAPAAAAGVGEARVSSASR